MSTRPKSSNKIDRLMTQAEFEEFDFRVQVEEVGNLLVQVSNELAKQAKRLAQIERDLYGKKIR